MSDPLHSSMKPFPYVNAMAASVQKSAGQPVENDGNPWKAKYNLDDYNQKMDLRKGLPGGYPEQEWPLPFPKVNYPITNVKKGYPPYMVIEEPTMTNIRSWANDVLHNGEENSDPNV